MAKRKSSFKKSKMEKQKCVRKRVLCFSVLFLISAALFYISGKYIGFSDFYGKNIYPIWVNTVGRVMGWIPFSVMEWGAYALIAAFLIRLIVGLIRVFAKKIRFKAAAVDYLTRLGVLLGYMALIFMLFCGINYNRSTFAETAGIEVVDVTRADLMRFLQVSAEKLNDLAPQVEADGFGHLEKSKNAIEEGRNAMARIGSDLPNLAGFYPKAKRLSWSEILSYQNLDGVYSAFTIEANVNADIPGYEYPFTICHEMSHLKGFMREDEANFIAFLACVGADDLQFRYSGWLIAFIYAGNELASRDADAYAEIRDSLDDQVKRDLAYGREFWAQYEGRIAEIQSRANDTYLKINNQEDGVESYDHVVELLISYLFYK